jgi:hypothetical protein
MIAIALGTPLTLDPSPTRGEGGSWGGAAFSSSPPGRRWAGKAGSDEGAAGRVAVAEARR